MFDLGWSKLIVIAIIAIVVVGPKDLPPLLRALGKFVAQLRRQADEFRAHFNEAMKDTGLDEVKRDIAGIKAAATETAQDFSRQLDESVKPLQEAVADIQRSGEIEAAKAAAAGVEASGDMASGATTGVTVGVTDRTEFAPHAVNGHPETANAHGDGSGAINGHVMPALPNPAMPTAVPPALQSDIQFPSPGVPLQSTAAAVPHKTQA